MEIALVLIAVFAVLVAVMAVVWAVRRPAPVVPGQPVAPLFDGTALAQQVGAEVKAQMADANIDDRMIARQEAIISSMTKAERKKPDLLNASRKKRIAAGAGLEIQDLNRLMKQQKMMAKMMKKMRTKGGMKNMMRGLEGMMGGNGGPGGSGGMGGPGGGMPPGGMGGGMPPM